MRARKVVLLGCLAVAATSSFGLVTPAVAQDSVQARIAWRVGPHAGALMIVGVFALAFLTFFGVPFVSVAPHKGAV